MRPLTPSQYRLAALAFFVFAAAVVAMGWVPGWYTYEGSERMLFGLFAMSALDDITHGVTAIAFLIAAFRGVPAMRLTFITFGSYYALDALFYLLNGFVNTLPWLSDIALNLPHVVISTAMLLLGYRLVPEAR
ncbi:MAG: hypothetical protein MUF00_03460 [Gemmatimonadaceae bacterium]|jgi:hypothetical protein|nr:hypothetical protein [Gemmatimonadaceae bacterium]